ncbi:MAG TPA: ABC transporter permease [bacterium]|nr:ABC transporter permease [bacterium]
MKASFQWQRARAIAFKETRHILRDPVTLAMTFALPLLMVAYFGYAIDFNMHEIHLDVYDRDQSRASRQLIEAFRSSNYFKVRLADTPVKPTSGMDGEAAKATLVIEPGFGRDFYNGRGAQAQVLVDGADNSTVGVVLGYLNGVKQIATQKLLSLKGGAVPLSPVQLRSRFLFNPELNTQWFMVPGLSVVVLAMLSIMLTALTIAREWENGSMELLLSTPVSPLEIIVGKLSPYVAVGVSVQLLIYTVARLLFGVPFEGSHLIFAAGALLFIASYMAQGLVISVATRQQRLAMQFSQITGMMPTLLLSGFIFPVENMPAFFHYFTGILPARWFMTIIREEFLMGPGLADLALPFTVLVFFNVLFVTLAVRTFKKDVEP